MKVDIEWKLFSKEVDIYDSLDLWKSRCVKLEISGTWDFWRLRFLKIEISQDWDFSNLRFLQIGISQGWDFSRLRFPNVNLHAHVNFERSQSSWHAHEGSQVWTSRCTWRCEMRPANYPMTAERHLRGRKTASKVPKVLQFTCKNRNRVLAPS